jgi:spore maturation protein CgeB
MVSSPWDDVEGLFRPNNDFLVARDSAEMQQHLSDLLHEPALRASLAANGLETVRKRHTCAHRVDELLAIDAQLRPADNRTEISVEATTAISTID